MNVMLTLMRKDWRTYRAPVVGTLVLETLPYAYLAIVYVANRDATSQGSGPSDWTGLVESSAIHAMMLLTLLAAAFGGTAWAADRMTGSASFIALLPPTRLQTITSKFTVAAGWLAFCFALNVAIGIAAITTDGAVRQSLAFMRTNFLVAAAALACYGIAVFGVAWACSTWLRSGTISAAIGIVAGLVFGPVVAVLRPEYRQPTWFTTMLTLGMLGLAIGTAHQLRRVAP